MSEIDNRVSPFPGLTLDLAGKNVLTLPAQRLARGAFEVVIKELDLYQKDPSAKPQARFITTVQEAGDFKGIDAYIFNGLEPGTNDVNVKRWKAAMLSTGAPAQVVEQNGVRIERGNFVGKRAYIFNDPGDADAPEGSRDRQDNRYFITPEEYQKIKSGALKVPERTKAASAATPAPVNGASHLPPPAPAIPSPAAAAPATNAQPAAFSW